MLSLCYSYIYAMWILFWLLVMYATRFQLVWHVHHFKKINWVVIIVNPSRPLNIPRIMFYEIIYLLNLIHMTQKDVASYHHVKVYFKNPHKTSYSRNLEPFFKSFKYQKQYFKH
jgi:hypothetical protein